MNSAWQELTGNSYSRAKDNLCCLTPRSQAHPGDLTDWNGLAHQVFTAPVVSILAFCPYQKYVSPSLKE